MAKTASREENALTESEEVFEKAADLFRVMSAPMRLRIISALCNGEKNVGELLAEIDTTQPNMSQHLNNPLSGGRAWQAPRGCTNLLPHHQRPGGDPLPFSVCADR